MFTVWTHIAPVNVLIITLLQIQNPSSWRQFLLLTNNSITTVSGSPAQSPSFQCDICSPRSVPVLVYSRCQYLSVLAELRPQTDCQKFGLVRVGEAEEAVAMLSPHTALLHYCTALLYTTSHCTCIVIYWYWQILPNPRQHRSSYTGHHLLDMATLLHCIRFPLLQCTWSNHYHIYATVSVLYPHQPIVLLW